MNHQLCVLGAIFFSASVSFAQTFTSSADATIVSKFSNSNYGSASILESDGSPLKSALIKFSVSGLTASVVTAKIRLYVTDRSADGPEIYQTSTSWSQSSVTWSNRPSVLSAKLDDRGSISSGMYVEYNVAAVVKANGEYSFLLKADSKDAAEFSSSESTRPPQLIITQSTVTPTPTPTPTPTATPTPTPTATPAPTPTPQPPSVSYFDNTHSTLNEMGVKIVSGSYGYTRYQFQESADGRALALDTREANFIVANSRNSNPVIGNDCSQGSLPVNRYTLNVYNADYTAVVGGIIRGEVPQQSDWKPTYQGVNESCNSAAVHFKYANSPAADGIRITSAWDAFRSGTQSPGLLIENSWVSNIRDDIVENDFYYNLTFKDNLVDGTFTGISAAWDSSTIAPPDVTNVTMKVSGNVIRIREYLYQGKMYYGSLFKAYASAPGSTVHNTVVAVDYNGGTTWAHYWTNSWSKIKSCSNNQFLWLSDAPIPSSVGTIPACFTVIKGQAARDAYAKAKTNWINCHPKVKRASTDPASDFAQCRAGEFGGFTD